MNQLNIPLKIAIICDPKRPSAKIQYLGAKLFENKVCPQYPYHAAWYDPVEDQYYDMHFQFRKAPKGSYRKRTVFFFDTPHPVYVEDIIDEVGKHYYGVFDVAFFALAKMFGVNLPGDHCSEVVNDQYRDKYGNVTPWKFYQSPPSPCAMLQWAIKELREWSPPS